jgi:hypothetical protein
MSGPWRVAVAVFGLTLAVGCTGGGDDTPASPGGGAPVAPVEDPQALLESIESSNSDSLLALADGAGDAGLVAAAEDALAAGATGDLKWAAVWVVVDGGTDAEVLVPFVNDDNPTIRVMAATGLVARGRVEGFEPLIAALTDETLLDNHYPPEPAWTAAATALVRWTGVAENGPPFDAVAGQRTTAQQRWTEWFDEHRDELRFDEDQALWVTS